MKTRGQARVRRRREPARGTAPEAVRLVHEIAGAAAPGTGDAVPPEESVQWVEVSEMFTELNLDADCIAAGLASLLIERDVIGLEAARARLGAEAMALLEGLLRFDELRAIQAEDATPAGRDARAERLRRLLLAAVVDVRILIMQLALTLHRLRTVRGRSPVVRERLAREGLELYAPLASRLGIWQYKWEIEDLAFRESDPAAYKTIAAQLNERRVDREGHVEDVVRRIEAELRRAGVEAEVTGRAKHIHSIWRKIQRKSLSVEQAGIGAALRPAGGARAREYRGRVLQRARSGARALERTFPGSSTTTSPTPSRTATGRCTPRSWGRAAGRWRCRSAPARCTGRPSSGSRPTGGTREDARGSEPGLDTRIAWLRQLLETREEADDAGSPLASLGRELESERVYAFTPRGDIVDLPAGSTPLDFAYQIHTQVGHRCRGAKVNGRIVPLTYMVRSGDRIEVLTTRNPRPSRDWLNPNLGYLGAARSRAKVRHWFKHQDRERNVADGQEIWDREVKAARGREPAPRGARGAVQRREVRGFPRRPSGAAT